MTTTTAKPSLVRRVVEGALLVALLAVLASLAIPQFTSLAPINVPAIPATPVFANDTYGGSGDVVYTLTGADGTSRAYIMNADAMSSQALGDVDARGLVWSYTGEQLAYVSGDDGERVIYVLPVGANAIPDLTAAEPITNAADDCHGPGWSPVGDELAAVCLLDGEPRLSAIALETGSLRAVSDSPINAVGGPRWSPTWRYLTYDFGTETRSLGVINITTDEVEQITSTTLLAERPRWAPDADFMAFVMQYREDPSGNVLVGVTFPDGMNLQTFDVPGDAAVNDIEWTPNGDYVAVALADNTIHLIEYATGDATDIAVPGADDGTLTEIAWRP